ncbi:hypothetical protein B0H13DRAFT_1883119 [Mycena leptocephala]|nr:hypothetical protein B0H13DRAFT_1883119 [Mycena leptocephala]
MHAQQQPGTRGIRPLSGRARSPMGEVAGRMGISDAGPRNAQRGESGESEESGRARSRRKRRRREERRGEEGKRRTRAGVRRSKGRKTERASTAGTDIEARVRVRMLYAEREVGGWAKGGSELIQRISVASKWVDEDGKQGEGRADEEGSACVDRAYEDPVEDVAAGALVSLTTMMTGSGARSDRMRSRREGKARKKRTVGAQDSKSSHLQTYHDPDFDLARTSSERKIYSVQILLEDFHFPRD